MKKVLVSFAADGLTEEELETVCKAAARALTLLRPLKCLETLRTFTSECSGGSVPSALLTHYYEIPN